MRASSIVAMIASMTVIIVCFLFDGWTGKDFIRAVTPDDATINWHDYTEEGLIANGNKMPDGTVQNPWDATDGSVEQVYAELLARVDANNSDRPSAALLAQHADDMDTRLGYNFLSRSRKSADPPNEAQKDFWHDSKYAKEVASKVVAVWEGAERVEIVEYNDYKSAYYMIHDGFSIDGKKAPLVVARQTDNSGGHFIKFTVRDINGEIAYLYYRLECGFQPIDPKVKVPDKVKPVEDNPNPGPGPGPGPSPDPEPKDPNGGYTPSHPDNPDTGGGKNKESDTKETKDPEPEKNSPSEYKAPDPPKADDGDKGSRGKGSGDSSKKSEDKKEDKKAKDDNGKKETYEDPDSGKKSEGTVRTGDSDQYDKRDEKVDKNPSPVEKGVNPPSSKKSNDSGKKSDDSSKKSNDSGKKSNDSSKKSNDSGKSSSGSEKKSEDSGGSNDKEIEAPE